MLFIILIQQQSQWEGKKKASEEGTDWSFDRDCV